MAALRPARALTDGRFLSCDMYLPLPRFKQGKAIVPRDDVKCRRHAAASAM
jgi:hypothetical protein